MDKTEKIYVCHANECQYNNQGSCQNDLDTVIIAVYDGIAQCPNYEKKERYDFDSRKTLEQGLIGKIKSIYFEIYSEDLTEDLEGDLSQYELRTDKKNNCFMVAKDSDYLQDFACDDRIACLVDAYNTVISGKPSIVTWQDN
ncbi:MAG: hypothetical protein H6Q74_1587 [Firmicutes bacterium]|nr:hypothetical protein [Bacillota bacterium]